VSWEKKLPRPIVLTDGRKLATLQDAGNLVLTFKGMIKDAPLEHAIELLIAAAESGKRKDVAAAAHQVTIVLRMRQMMGID
jgi:hypothetical protein